MNNKSALIAGILAGLTAPGSLFAAPEYPRVSGTDLSRMRKDVQRVGVDFSTVIVRENAKTKNKSK
jgi:hypothetical protein